MLDQDTARALLTIADETGARVVLDRRPPPAPRRRPRGSARPRRPLGATGARLDRSTPSTGSPTPPTPTSACRCALVSTVVRSSTLCWRAARSSSTPPRSSACTRWPRPLTVDDADLVIADTRDRSPPSTPPSATAASTAGEVDDHRGRSPPTLASASASATGSPPAATTATSASPTATPGPSPHRRRRGARACTAEPATAPCPAGYVREHVELAYATTVYGAQGETVDPRTSWSGSTTGAAAAYVGMTRGRDSNTAHLVADSVEDARRQWIEVFARDRADLGPAHAARGRRRGHRALRTVRSSRSVGRTVASVDPKTNLPFHFLRFKYSETSWPKPRAEPGTRLALARSPTMRLSDANGARPGRRPR